MVPVAEIRAQGLDVRVARYAPSDNISIAMFSGGGMAWADAAMKRGEIAVPQAPPGAHPDLSGLSCRYEEIPASRGLVLSLVVAPGRKRGCRGIPRCDRGDRPYRGENPRRVAAGAGPAAPFHLAAGRRRSRGAGVAPRRRIDPRPQDQGSGADVFVFPDHALQHHGRRFIPAKYTRELIDNSDFRKFDDSLRMVLDCTPALADEIEQHLMACAAKGHRALRHAPPARRDDDLLHAVADPLQPRALHRRRDGRLCDGGERDEAERGLTRVVVPLLLLQREHQRIAA